MMQSDIYVSPLAASLNVPTIFDYFWNLERTWFEDPNIRRGGWSGAIKQVLKINGVDYPVFVKIQSNSTFCSIKNFFRRRPTFSREFAEMQKAHKAGVKTADLIYYGERGLDAVLVTHSLEGYEDLEKTLATQPANLREKILHQLTNNLISLHQARIAHMSLFAKHVLIKVNGEENIDVRLIDFEKSRQKCSSYHAMVTDVERLFRRCEFLTLTDQQLMLKAYETVIPAKKAKCMQQKITQRTAKKLAKKCG